jgi:P27 family predicted phage terminase small subunit
MAGRKPKPKAVKKLQGTYRPDRDKRKGKKAPEPASGAKPPTWLNADGRRFWRGLAPTLERNGLLTELSLPAFAILCDTWGRMMEAREVVKDEGYIYVSHGESGRQIKKNPAVGILEQAQKDFKTLGVEFGLTPSALEKLTTSPPEEIDPDEKALFGEMSVIQGGKK